VETTVVAVELFRHSALVHREGDLQPDVLGPSCSCVEIGGLPLGLVDGSVRVALEPHPPGVLEIQVMLDVQASTEEVEVQELERLKKIQRQMEQLRRRQRRLEAQSAAIGKLVPTLPPLPRRPDQERFAADPVEAWLALDRFVHQEGSARLEQSRQMDREASRLEDELKQALDQVARLSGAKTAGLRLGKRIQLWLSEPPRRPQRLRLTYQVPGARWFPSYELRLLADGARAELVMSARVGQVAGEDWHGVAVSLSTADLQRRCDMPRLGAWRIGRAAPPDRRPAWRELPEDLPQLFSDYDRERPPSPPPPPPGTPPRHDALLGALSHGSVSSHDEEVGFSPAEITRETTLAAPEEVVDREQAFDDEPTPHDQPAPAAYAPQMMQAMAPPAAMAPSPMMKRSAMAPSRASQSKERPRPQPRPQPPIPGAASLVPSDDLLTFGGLVLSAGDERGRGMLRPLRSEEQLPSELRQPEVLQALEQAEQQRANQILELRTMPTPRGTKEVGESAGHFAYRYTTQARADLPSDGALHRLPVLRQPLKPELVCRTIPALDDVAYRLARLQNPLELPLLAGPLDVFWGNDYLVTAHLPTTAQGAAIEANLGVEPRIKIARNVHHSQHEEGLLSGRTVYQDEIRIEVRNGLQHSTVVEVIERVPVSDERKVEVKRLEESPAAEDYDQSERQRPIRGARRFTLALEPGQTRECLLRYNVTLPASSEIVGGGRRA